MKLPFQMGRLRMIAFASVTFLSACGGGSAEGPSTAGSSSNGSTSSSTDVLKAALVTPLSSNLPAQTATSTATQTGTRLLATTVTSGNAAFSGATPAGQDGAQFALTFEDNFDGELDTGTWNTGRTDSANSVANYGIRNGALKIWPERGNNGEFFNRTLDTEGKFSQKYGYFEVEAKLPKGKGAWPAFWLFNQFGEHRPEIDILEAYSGGLEPWSAMGSDGVPAPVMYAPVVWSNDDNRAGYGNVATPDMSADFHKYGLKWEPNKTTFYFDGREVYTLDVSMSDPLYIILDLWFGSASGSPDQSTPAGEGNAFEINYVRAWQFK